MAAQVGNVGNQNNQVNNGQGGDLEDLMAEDTDVGHSIYCALLPRSILVGIKDCVPSIFAAVERALGCLPRTQHQ